MSDKIDFQSPKPFPMALLDFKRYDGAKAFALLIFLLSLSYFGSGLLNIVAWENTWWKPDAPMKMMYFLYHLLVFTLVYCLTWLVFDKKGIEGYALSMFSTLLGITYVLSPIDFIPEAIPLAGSLDDVIIGIGSVIVGMKGYQNNKRNSEYHDDIMELIRSGNSDEAIKLYIKKSGYKIVPGK